jgi:2-polyprenyl-6-methoxyphenol hydroxylase-like FAD-dependent oxidoreductase
VLDVAVVGGGPVGLFLGILLRQSGLEATVLERRQERSPHSRAIGIHPPALQALEQSGVVSDLLAHGVKIRSGSVHSGGQRVAALGFDSLPAPHRYVLAVPQAVTERILEERLLALDPAALRRGTAVNGVHDAGTHVQLPAAGPEAPGIITARLVVGADGPRSTVRGCAGIPAPVAYYPDTYLMGDFRDETVPPDTREEAVLYLEPAGVVESFPLPGRVRRWVVRTPVLAGHADARELARLIRERTGTAPDPASNTMLSAFRVRRRLARRLVAGRTVLVGDAAHEVSPIGGQGMTLGWLDAARLAPIITASLREGTDVGAALRHYTRDRRSAARRAALLAHANMVLGRPLPAPVLRARNRALAAATGNRTLEQLLARTFTMQHEFTMQHKPGPRA